VAEPYHGRPDKDELLHSAPKSGTTKFHAYATAYVVHSGFRDTLALTPMSPASELLQASSDRSESSTGLISSTNGCKLC
jgi:hypothetical protein